MKINHKHLLSALATAAATTGGLVVGTPSATASPAEVGIVTYYSDPGFTHPIGQVGRTCTTGASFSWGRLTGPYKELDYYPCDQASPVSTTCYGYTVTGLNYDGTLAWGWEPITCPWGAAV